MDNKADVFRLMENVIYLKKYTLFSDLNTEELRTLAFIASEIQVRDSEPVVREGDAGDSFFIVKRGELRVVKGSGARAVELSRIRQNECVGEMVVFEEGELRSASLVAVGDCSLLVFHRDDLYEAITKHPAIATELIKIFSRRLREANAKILVANKSAAS